MTWSSINGSDLSDGSQPDLGRYRIKYTITDSDGNEVIKYRIVTVQDTIAPTISLVGPTNDNLECGDTYSDPGATVTDNDPQASYTHSDTNTATGFTRTYTPSDRSGNTGSPVTRTVTVQDTTDPIVTLSGASPMIVEAGSSFSDPGATYFDTCDGSGTVTGTGTVNTAAVGSYTRSYTYTDGGGNSDTVTRTVSVVDTTAPVITLNGSASLTVANGGSFTDPGATWSDAVDGSGTITGSGSVNTSTAGTYTLTYSKTDSSGNTGTATRTVTVGAAPANHLEIACAGWQAYNSQTSSYRTSQIPRYLKEVVLRPNATHNVQGQIIQSSDKFSLSDLTSRKLGNSSSVTGLGIYDSTGNISPWNLGSTSGASLGTEVDVNNKMYYRVSVLPFSGQTVPIITKLEKNPLDSGATDIFYGYYGPHIFDSELGWSNSHFSDKDDDYEWDVPFIGSNPLAMNITKVTTALINQWKNVITGTSSDLTDWDNQIWTQLNGTWYNNYADYREAYIDAHLQAGDYLALMWFDGSGSDDHDVSSKLSACPSTYEPIHYSTGRPLFYDTQNNLDTSEQNFSATWYNSKIPSYFYEHSYSSAPSWNFSDATPGTPNGSQKWVIETKNANYAIYTADGSAGQKMYFIKGGNGFDYVYGKFGLCKFTGWKKKDGSSASSQYIYADMLSESPNSSSHPYGSLVAGTSSHVRLVWDSAYTRTTPP